MTARKQAKFIVRSTCYLIEAIITPSIYNKHKGCRLGTCLSSGLSDNKRNSMVPLLLLLSIFSINAIYVTSIKMSLMAC